MKKEQPIQCFMMYGYCNGMGNEESCRSAKHALGGDS